MTSSFPRPAPSNWEEDGVCELNLPPNLEGILDRHGILTLGQLCSQTPEQLLRLRHVKLRGLAHIYEGLVRYGLLSEVPAWLQASLRKKANTRRRPRARRQASVGDDR